MKLKYKYSLYPDQPESIKTFIHLDTFQSHSTRCKLVIKKVIITLLNVLEYEYNS